MNKMVGKYLVRDAQDTDFNAMLEIYRASVLYKEMVEEFSAADVDFDVVAAEELRSGKRYVIINTENDGICAYVEWVQDAWEQKALRIMSQETFDTMDAMILLANIMVEQGIKPTRDWTVVYDAAL